jgi:hypothetical protein
MWMKCNDMECHSETPEDEIVSSEIEGRCESMIVCGNAKRRKKFTLTVAVKDERMASGRELNGMRA